MKLGELITHFDGLDFVKLVDKCTEDCTTLECKTFQYLEHKDTKIYDWIAETDNTNNFILTCWI